jgi:hypothetical protein
MTSILVTGGAADLSARTGFRKISAPLIKAPALRQNLDHGRENPKSTYDCSARFRAGLGAGFRSSPRCAHLSCGPLPGNRICGALLFGLGVSQGLAAAPVECRFHSLTGSSELARNKRRRMDRQTGIHHRRARAARVRAWHGDVFRGQFAAGTTDTRIATIFAPAGNEAASIALILWQDCLLK